MKRKTSVCVIVAAWNAQTTIGRAVSSALAQPNVGEVVVVDDASPDGTSLAARAADDGSGRLRVIMLPENAGPSRARNVALDHSQSPYVCVLDADDYFLPGRIARLLATATQGWDFLADDIVIVPERLEHLLFSLAGPEPGAGFRLDLATLVRGNIAHPRRPRGEMGFLKPIIRRDFLREHGLRYDDDVRLGEDYCLYVRALIAGAGFHVVPACGYIAVERQSSISSRHSAGDLERIVDFDARCLAGDQGLSRAERSALAAHRAATQRKYDYRRVLDCKRDYGLLPAIGALARVPDSLPYIASQTIRARVAAYLGGHDGDIGSGPRLLIGIPGIELSWMTADDNRDTFADGRNAHRNRIDSNSSGGHIS